MKEIKLSTALFAVSAVLFGNVALMSFVAAQEAEPEPEGGAAAATDLDCGDDELVYHQILDLRPDDRAPGGPDSAREALDAFLDEHHPYLDASDFDTTATSEEAAQFGDEVSNRDLATVYAEELPAVVSGDSAPGPDIEPAQDGVVTDWFVTSFSACARFLNNAEGGY